MQSIQGVAAPSIGASILRRARLAFRMALWATAICVLESLFLGRAQAATPGAGSVFATSPAATPRAADATFDCPDVFGRVFHDSNADGLPDPGERGIAGVRLATVRGLLVSTDAEGRFHIPCPETPNAVRGGNFVMKLDERTLPTGYRMTTPNPRDIRLTRGRAGELDFGAALFHTVRVAMEDAAFMAGSTDLQAQWRQQVDALPAALLTRPSVIVISYKTGADAPQLVSRRVAALREGLEQHWKALHEPYALTIETE